MWPTEALLAGGGGIYKVKADEKIWPKGSDPLKVMQAQSTEPDDSAIEITFKNSWQFEGYGTSIFVVTFKNGLAVDIKNINPEGGV